MVDIISKRDGPRREDAAAKRLIDANRGTITRLADQLTSGGYSASRAAAASAAQPLVPEGKIIRDLAAGSRRSEGKPKPMIKISVNNRVLVMDAASGRQMHFLGELRRRDGVTYFALATRENGFFSPVDAAILPLIEELDGVIIDQTCTEKALAGEIAGRLGFQ